MLSQEQEYELTFAEKREEERERKVELTKHVLPREIYITIER